MDYNFFLARIISGLAYGSIYGFFALSMVVLFRSNRLFNIALTEIATLVVITMFFLLRKVSYALGISSVLVGAGLLGLFLHFSIMRVITSRRNSMHSNELIVTIGLFSIFNSLSAYIFGDEPERFPAPFGNKLVSIFSVQAGIHSILIFVVGCLLALLIHCFFNFSKIGITLEAISENATAARLRGINVSNYLSIAWALTVILASLGGILVAPLMFVSPSMLVYVFSYSLIAVAIGGLESTFGALLSGLLIGVTESLASMTPFVGSELKLAAVFALLIAVLIIRPRGIWGRKEQRRV